MEERVDKIRWPELIQELSRRQTVKGVADKICVSEKTVGRWKTGESKPKGSVKALLDLSDGCQINWRKYAELAPIYDFRVSYDKNVEDGPQCFLKEPGWIPRVRTRLFDLELNSPLGVPASVLTINSQWIGPLSNLGFDVLTYKTCRTEQFPSHPFPNGVYLPNLQEPLQVGALPEPVHGVPDLPYEDIQKISFANSFGMPSPAPQQWQEDLEKTLQLLKRGQILLVSIVGTAKKQGDSLIADTVKCAEFAHEVNQDMPIELNFSCPNVYGREGSIYQDSNLAGQICKKIAQAIPNAKMLVKTGYLRLDELSKLFDATYKHVVGYTAINTLPARIIAQGQREEPAFLGIGRAKAGISGVAIKKYALDTVKNLRKLAKENKEDLVIIGVGGISSIDDVKLFLNGGADCVQLCTAALLNPLIAAEIRNKLSQGGDQPATSRFLGAGVTFTDNSIARAVDHTIKVCSRLGVPFDKGYEVLRKSWLISYLKDINEPRQSASPQKTRREPPLETEIEAWVRCEELEDEKIL